jgi:D-lactate dehydrogenase
MAGKKIILYDTKPYEMAFFDIANFKFGYDIKYINGHLTLDTLKLAEGYQVVCVFVNDIISKELISALPGSGIELIALRCAGYNNVDLKAAFKKIHVVRVPEYSPYAVAEHAVALILSLNRKTHKAYYRIRDNNFTISGFMGFDMHGKCAGIIGTGKIGKALISILKGFGMEVLAYDKFPDHKASSELGYEYVDLQKLLKRSDIISLHCPLNKETKHLINEENIASMKDGVMIINTGRGQLVDTKALIAGMKTGKIGSAGLDVYEEESEYFFEDFSDSIIEDDVLARLISFPNVLITSHQAFFTKEAMTKIAETTLSNVKEYFDGGYLANEICYRCGKDCVKKKGQRCFLEPGTGIREQGTG